MPPHELDRHRHHRPEARWNALAQQKVVTTVLAEALVSAALFTVVGVGVSDGIQAV
jgi:hypothetical protein